MADDVISIKYEHADTEIGRIKEGIDNLENNFRLIDEATDGIINNGWKGKDAEAYRDSINSYTEILKKQTEGLTTLVNILKNQIEEDRAFEEEQAKAAVNS